MLKRRTDYSTHLNDPAQSADDVPQFTTKLLIDQTDYLSLSKWHDSDLDCPSVCLCATSRAFVKARE